MFEELKSSIMRGFFRHWQMLIQDGQCWMLSGALHTVLKTAYTIVENLAQNVIGLKSYCRLKTCLSSVKHYHVVRQFHAQQILFLTCGLRRGVYSGLSTTTSTLDWLRYFNTGSKACNCKGSHKSHNFLVRDKYYCRSRICTSFYCRERWWKYRFWNSFSW